MTDSSGNPFLAVGGVVHGRIPLMTNEDGSLSAVNGEGTKWNLDDNPERGVIKNFFTNAGRTLSGDPSFDIIYTGSIPDSRKQPGRRQEDSSMSNDHSRGER